MNKPVVSPTKSIGPEQKSSVFQENSFPMEQATQAQDLLQENMDLDGLSSKSGCHTAIFPLNAKQKNPKNYTHDDSIIEAIDTTLVEVGSQKKLHSGKPLLDLNVKAKESTTLPVPQPFNEAQQCQLRTQILVYGSLIEGALPSEALMGVAFADISKVGRVESWEDYVKDSKSSWEKIWKATALRVQRNAAIAAPSWPLTPNSTSISMAGGSKVTANNDPFAFLLPKISKNRGSPEVLVGKKNSKGAKSPHVNSSLPSEFYSQVAVSSCTTSSWNVSLSSKQVTQNIQGAGSCLGSWDARSRRLPYPQHGSFPAPCISPYSTSERWASPTPATGFDESAHSQTFSESVTLNGHLGFQYPPYGSTLPIIHPVACTSASTAACNLANVNAVKAKEKGEAKSSEKHESKTKKRKEVGFSAGTPMTSSAKSSFDNPSNMAVRLNYATNDIPMATTPSTQAVSTTIEGNNEREAMATPARFANIERGTVVAVSSSFAEPSTSAVNNFISAQEGDAVKELSSQSTSMLLQQAKLSAQEAANFATMALEQSQTIWNQIKNSKLDTAREAEVAASATTVAASASVAKAAAAAAKLAYEAAVQAAAMTNDSVNSHVDSMSNETGSDLLNVLEGESKKSSCGRWQLASSSTSILSAAKAKVKKQILSAESATKKAQNLEAAVQAAELAVEAAWQVGAVVAMGDPVPMTLQALKEAGMENYWKVGLTELEQEFGNMPASSAREVIANELKTSYAQESGGRSCGRRGIVRVERGKDNSTKKNIKVGRKPIKRKFPKKKDIKEHKADKKAGKPKKLTGVDVNEQVTILPANFSSCESQVFSSCKQVDLELEPHKIVEGSVVEVVPDEEGLQGVWFSAKVLSVKDNQVLVRYDELLADNGNEKLQEWVPHNATGTPSQNAPRVRLAHPIVKDEVSRKRRRSVIAKSSWTVGDHVDAWMRDGWWEGVVTRSVEDETKVTVYFPGDGDVKAIKSWNLRPSLVWKDGSWVPYSHQSKESNHPENQNSDVTAASFPVAVIKDNAASNSQNRTLVPSLVLSKSTCEHELVAGSFDAADVAKKRKYISIRKKTGKARTSRNIAQKLKKNPKVEACSPLSHAKPGRAKKPGRPLVAAQKLKSNPEGTTHT